MATLERLKQVVATREQIEQARKAEKYGKVEELVATYGLLRGISSPNYDGKEQSRVYVEQALACAQKLCDAEIPDEREKLMRRVCRNCNAAQQCAVDADYPLGADIARALFSLVKKWFADCRPDASEFFEKQVHMTIAPVRQKALLNWTDENLERLIALHKLFIVSNDKEKHVLKKHLLAL